MTPERLARKVAYNLQHRQEKMHMLKTEFGGKCRACKFKKSFFALDFHHVDPSNKSFSISKQRGKPYEALREEAKKCVLVCKNCHAMIHQKTLDCPPLYEKKISND